MTEALGEDHYDTKTRGERVRPAARPAGEGVYVLARTGSKMHLAYALELPDKPGPVQKQLNIEPEASFALSIKNPEKGSPRNTGLTAPRRPITRTSFRTSSATAASRPKTRACWTTKAPSSS